MEMARFAEGRFGEGMSCERGRKGKTNGLTSEGMKGQELLS